MPGVIQEADRDTSLRNVVERLPIADGHAVLHRQGVGSGGARVLILPPFAVPASELGLVADLLVAEGHETLILDGRSNNGEGSGEIIDFRLSTLIEDCRVAIAHYRPEIVVAVSLSARAAVRAIATSDHAPRSVLLLPVVDLRATLTEALGRDWFAVSLESLPTHVEALGFAIRSEPFWIDCVDLGILSPESTRLDLEAIEAPVTLLPGTKDPWISHTTITGIFDVVGSKDPSIRMRSLACDQHELHKHPALAIRLIGECVSEVLA